MITFITTKKYSLLCESNTDFTRKNKLTFSSVALIILNLFKESAEYNLATLLPAISSKTVKGPAFSMARYKIKLSFFLGLNDIIAEHLETLKPKLWNGFRVIAGDGTTVNLPPSPSIKKHFGIFRETQSGTKTCLANSCILYDVLSNFTLDAIVSPICIGEGTLMNNMLFRFKWKNSIILLDRGVDISLLARSFLVEIPVFVSE
ncbi:MAG: hypothetical protein NVV82_16995 [Sporocytophaga sp.]|nr:hypothetical protein [Sporocytophaga sp.]